MAHSLARLSIDPIEEPTFLLQKAAAAWPRPRARSRFGTGKSGASFPLQRRQQGQ